MHKHLLLSLSLVSITAHAMYRPPHQQHLLKGDTTHITQFMEQCAQRCAPNPAGALECTSQCMDEQSKAALRVLLLQKNSTFCNDVRNSLTDEQLFTGNLFNVKQPDLTLIKTMALFKCAQQSVFQRPPTYSAVAAAQKVWTGQESAKMFSFATDRKSKTKQ